MALKHKQCQGCATVFFFEAGEEWKTTCIPCFKARKRRERMDEEREAASRARPQTGVIQKDMLSRLIRLCHPDRHQNSEASTIATQWLLSQREKR